MKLNCRKNELAWISGGPKSYGRVVRTIRLIKAGEIVKAKCGTPVRALGTEPTWLIEGYAVFTLGIGGHAELPVCADRELRPIRDSDGQDETLTWAPVPKKVEA